MKKFNLLLAGVLFCTVVFAHGTIEPTASTSVAVTHVDGSSLYKVYYAAYMQGNVKVSIMDQSGKIVFNERVRKTDGFIRPYNFKNMQAGTYTIEVDNGENKYTKEINYNGGRIEKLVNLVKISDDGRYLFSAKVKHQDQITVSVYNKENQLVYSEDRSIQGDFAQVLNLKKLSSFTVEVSDSNGVVKAWRN
jgi:hypothetical protein